MQNTLYNFKCLAVVLFTITAVAGCATTGSTGSVSNVPLRDYDCNPISPNSNIVNLTASVNGNEMIAYIKRRGEAIGKKYVSVGRSPEQIANGTFKIETGEIIQCRAL